YYSLPYSLGQKLWIFVGNITSVIFPTASALAGRNSSERLQELYVRSTKFVAAVAAFPALALWLFRYQLLYFWISPDFATNSALCLGVLSWGFLVNGLAHVPATICPAIGRPNIGAR